MSTNSPITINVIANDTLTPSWTIGLDQGATFGTVSNLNNGSFSLDFAGVTTDDYFIYNLCNPSCANVCDTAIVYVYVYINELTDCAIPNIFTPNGDNINDYFEIPCLTGQGNKLLGFQ